VSGALVLVAYPLTDLLLVKVCGEAKPHPNTTTP